VRVVDAHWEERNLGLVSTEVSIDQHDDVSTIRSVLIGLRAGYQVVKVPVARYDVMSMLEDWGFSFIEGTISVQHDLSIPEPSGLLRRMVDASTVSQVESSAVERVAEEIQKGLFTTDRVFLDPHFGPSRAGSRYVNWMFDEVARGGTVHELSAASKAVGFFVFREDENRVGYSILSGLYETANSPGLGSVLLYKILAEAASRNLRCLSSHISTNNLPVIKTHIDQGFTVVDLQYVYVRTTAIPDYPDGG